MTVGAVRYAGLKASRLLSGWAAWSTRGREEVECFERRVLQPR